MEREIEDLTTQQPEVLLVPEGIQLNYEFMGCDLLVLLPPGRPSVAQITKPETDPTPWPEVQFWARATMRVYLRWGPDMATLVVALRDHIARHRSLIEMFAAMSEPAGDGEDHQDQDDDEQDGSEVHAALVPTSEGIEP
jgi:hypothetical protein